MHSAQKSLLIGVAGGTGSGKSTVTRLICESCGQAGVAVIDQDSYYRDRSHLPEAERDLANFDEPAALDFDLLAQDLRQLLSGSTILKPRYSFVTHCRAEGRDRVEPARVVVLEGLFALWDERIREMMSLKVFVDAREDLRFRRRLERDVRERGRTPESVQLQFEQTVAPMHRLHIAPTQQFADVVVENSGTFQNLAVQIRRALERLDRLNPAFSQ